MSRRALACALACSGALACSKVANPFYVDEVGEGSSGTDTSGETADTSSTSLGDTSDADTLTTSESDTASTTDTSSDTDCPPSQSGCPCIDGTMCFPGLTCLDGLCFAPEDCAGPSAGIVATLGYEMGGADTNCTVGATPQDGGVVLGVYGCEDMVTTLSITLDPLPPELAEVVTRMRRTLPGWP